MYMRKKNLKRKQENKFTIKHTQTQTHTFVVGGQGGKEDDKNRGHVLACVDKMWKHLKHE
jgi:hypothetical protein